GRALAPRHDAPLRRAHRLPAVVPALVLRPGLRATVRELRQRPCRPPRRGLARAVRDRRACRERALGRRNRPALRRRPADGALRRARLPRLPRPARRRAPAPARGVTATLNPMVQYQSSVARAFTALGAPPRRAVL